MLLMFMLTLYGVSLGIVALLAPRPELPDVDWSLPTKKVRTSLFGSTFVNTELNITPKADRCGYCSSKVRVEDVNCQNCGAST